MAFETILNFAAGYATYDDATKTVTPRPGPGRITVSKDPQEPYYSFAWEPRDGFEPPETVTAREPLLLIPGDAQWTHCRSKTNGRVFALKFQSSDQREFFWMQARTDAKDKNPATLSSEDKLILATFQKILTEDEDEDMEDQDDDEAAATSSSTTADSLGAAAPASKSEDSSDQNAASSFTSGPQWDSFVKSVAEQVRKRTEETSGDFPILSISNAFSPSDFIAYVQSASAAQLAPLYGQLPEEIPRNKDELERVIRSSQFAQGVESLSAVLRQGGLGHVLASELDFPYQGEGVAGYLNGIYQGEKARAEKKDEPREDKDGDESME